MWLHSKCNGGAPCSSPPRVEVGIVLMLMPILPCIPLSCAMQIGFLYLTDEARLHALMACIGLHASELDTEGTEEEMR